MRIGYPCSNLTLRESAARTFRLASYSEERLIETVTSNLDSLERYLTWNADHGIAFFRISSGTIPFASHPVMTFDWKAHFGERLAEIGAIVRDTDMRTNVHPGQYTLINALREDVVAQSVAELVYHADLLDLMGLDHTHKIQIHVGGVYGDKPTASERFVSQYRQLPGHVRARLVIENDERQYALADALAIHHETGIPVLFDIFHHQIFNNRESLEDALDGVIPTWQGHGPAMLDYSSQHPERQAGAHTESIDLDDFAGVLDALAGRDVDLMLEIKDKEASALAAIGFAEARGVPITRPRSIAPVPGR